MDLNIALKLFIVLDISVLCEGKGSDGILLGGLVWSPAWSRTPSLCEFMCLSGYSYWWAGGTLPCSHLCIHKCVWMGQRWLVVWSPLSSYGDQKSYTVYHLCLILISPLHLFSTNILGHSPKVLTDSKSCWHPESNVRRSRYYVESVSPLLSENCAAQTMC